MRLTSSMAVPTRRQRQVKRHRRRREQRRERRNLLGGRSERTQSEALASPAGADARRERRRGVRSSLREKEVGLLERGRPLPLGGGGGRDLPAAIYIPGRQPPGECSHGRYEHLDAPHCFLYGKARMK
jgi:hypothetical protein